MSYWKAFAGKYPSRPMLRLDAGSLFSQGEASSGIRNRWMLEGSYRSQMDAVNLSAWDLPAWQEMGDMALAGLVPSEYLNVPLVSANVTARAPGFPAIRRYVIKDVLIDAGSGRKLRIGITGVMSAEERESPDDSFQVQAPEAALSQVIGELKDRTDYRIVLTDMSLGKAISLAVILPDINLVAVAHNYAAITDPQQVGKTLIVTPVNEGRMLSEIRLKFVNPKDGSADRELQARFVPLDATVPDDPAMKELLRKAQAEVGRLP